MIDDSDRRIEIVSVIGEGKPDHAIVLLSAGILVQPPDAEDRARRLVACWNACIDVSLDELEHLDGVYKTQLTKVRDELREYKQAHP